MVACKDFRKGIIQLQWEHKKMQMQMEDLNNKSRDIRRLKLTEEQRDVSVIRILWNPYISHFDSLSCLTINHFTQKSLDVDNGGFCPLYIASISEVFWFEQWFWGKKTHLRIAGFIGNTKADSFFFFGPNQRMTDCYHPPPQTGIFLETDTFFISAPHTVLLMCLILFKDVS